ncbi:MAG: site-specific DNA-methyltransferase [Lachnospiraceae bacterium]|nr:site-specific DNA-methyltransferase [Lachnospiraceae bacterium]
MKEKAARNRTIDFSVEEGSAYLDRCYRAGADTEPIPLRSIMNQFILGDCFSVMDRLPRGFVDLLIVDPPYNLAKDYHGNKFNPQSQEDYHKYTVSWVEKVVPLLKETASIYVCCDWRSSLIIGEVLYHYFKIQNRITWQREKGRGAKKNWKNGMEDVWYATVGKEYTFNLESVKVRKKVIAPYKTEGKPKDWEETEAGNYRNTCPSNFWDDISIPYWSMPENTAHPTQKPEKLIAKMILASSNEGDIVMDPFAGSGTSAVVAKKLNRNYVVMEQNELYGAWAQKRLEMAEADSSIQGYHNGVFWERNTFTEQRKEKEVKR